MISKSKIRASIIIVISTSVLYLSNVFFMINPMMSSTLNVYGKPIEVCCNNPVTGYYRDGKCITGADDFGTHIVCAQVTDEFLKFSKAQGNDLIAPRPEYNFPGLIKGNCWCLCISRWQDAERNNVAPLINLNATHQKALEYVDLATLEKYAIIH